MIIQLFSLFSLFLIFDGSRNASNNHFTVCDNTLKCWPVYMVNEKHVLGYRCLRPCSGFVETVVTDKAINISEYKSVHCSLQHTHLLPLDFIRGLFKAKVLRPPVPPSFYSYQMLTHFFLYPSCAYDSLTKVGLELVRYDLHCHLQH